MKQEFYEKLLPAKGVYCVASIDKAGVKARFAESLADVIKLTDKFKEGSNVYVTPNSFSGYSRLAKHGAYGKSLFVDLDVGDNKEYSTQAEALEALDSFVSSTKLPDPVVVNSGTGIQAYWIFTTEIPIDEWKPLADSFKQFCLDNDLKFDAAVTADISRLMRCPDTLNFKTDPPRPTSVISEEIHQYEVDLLKSIIEGSGADPVKQSCDVSHSNPNVLAVLASIPKGIDAETAAVAKDKYDDIESYWADILTKSREGMGCAQIKRLDEAQDKQNYNEWFWALSIIARCEDGTEGIHEFSKGHPDYNRDDTIFKANETLKVSGPQKCSVMEALNPEGCKDCPYKGSIGSPLALGHRVKGLPPEQMPASMPALPAALAPYAWSEGGIWYTPPPEMNKKGKWVQNDPFLICPTIFYPVARLYGKAEGAVLTMRAVLPRDEEREFDLPVKHIAATDKFREILSMQDILPASPSQTYVTRMADYMIKWNEYLKNAQTAELMQTQMGWTENHESFILGHQEVTFQGKVKRAAAATSIRAIAKMLDPVGSYALWKKSANALNQPGLEQLMFGLMCGFGSPLMEFTRPLTPGVSVCYTGESGGGKSGTLYSGLSIWGDPQQIGPNHRNATANALIGRYLNLKNIFMGLDEVHNIEGKELSQFLFAVSTGKPKIRMQSSINAERELERPARLICMMNSNTDLNMVLRMNKADPEGESSRFIQFLFRKPEMFDLEPHRAPEIINPFNENYAHAGVEYIQNVYKTGIDAVRDRMDYWGKKFDVTYNAGTKDRFYRSLITTSFTGAEIAYKAGIVDIDLPRMYKCVMDDLIDERDKTRSHAMNYEEVLNTFLNENIGRFLKMDGNRVVDMPSSLREFVGRKEIDTRLVYVHRDTFRKWMAHESRKINVSKCENHLREAGVLVDVTRKRLGAGWSTASDIGSVNCLVFKMDIEDVNGSN